MKQANHNLIGLVKNSRTRMVIMLTFSFLLIIVLISAIKLAKLHDAQVKAASNVVGSPNISSIPGGFGGNKETQNYVALQNQQNVSQAKAASTNGTDAIPTITSSQDFAQPQQSSAFNQNSGKNCCCKSNCAFATNVRNPIINNAIVYDECGKIIGYVDKNGNVKNADGITIGQIGPDGLVRDMGSNVIGQIGSARAGMLVRGADGKIIGVVGPDGKVRNAEGQIIGIADANGVVRDLKGNIIGSASKQADSDTVPGAPVYDSNGKLIGVVGQNGVVTGLDGKPIGKLNANGTVTGLDGKIIGKVGNSLTGKPVYNSSGQLIGFAQKNGEIIGQDGKVIGTVGNDGIARDSNGMVIGQLNSPNNNSQAPQANALNNLNTGASSMASLQPVPNTLPSPQSPNNFLLPNPNANPNANDQAQALAAATAKKQKAILTAQMQQQLSQNLQSGMSNQANQLAASWTAPQQSIVIGESIKTSASGANGNNSASLNPNNDNNEVIKAGTIMYGVLMTKINTDQPGPIMVKIIRGKFENGIMLGSIVNQGEKVLLKFTSVSVPNIKNTIPVNVVGINSNTSSTAFSSYTDNHYLLRYGSILASSFIQGYGQAVALSGATVLNGAFSQETSYPPLKAKDRLYVALGNVGAQIAPQVNAYYNTPPTVYVNEGTAMGLLFMSDTTVPIS